MSVSFCFDLERGAIALRFGQPPRSFKAQKALRGVPRRCLSLLSKRRNRERRSVLKERGRGKERRPFEKKKQWLEVEQLPLASHAQSPSPFLSLSSLVNHLFSVPCCRPECHPLLSRPAAEARKKRAGARGWSKKSEGHSKSPQSTSLKATTLQHWQCPAPPCWTR